MADREFVSLEPELSASVPGCPRPTLVQYIRRAAIEVCEKTLVWRFEQDLIRLTAGVYEYDYDVPLTTEVCGLIHATLNGAPLIPATQEQIHASYPSWPSPDATQRGAPRLLGQFDPDHFVVAVVPDDSITYDVKLFLALKPTLEATGMARTPFDECEALIAHGALQHLLVLPNKSWTDRELASYHAKQYVYKTAQRRAKANLGVARASLSVQMHPLA